jgi:hypothetical protein
VSKQNPLNIYSLRLNADKDRFYAYFVKSMMKYDSSLLANAKIISDGSGDREFRNNLNCALRRQLGKGVSRIFASKIPAVIC